MTMYIRSNMHITRHRTITFTILISVVAFNHTIYLVAALMSYTLVQLDRWLLDHLQKKTNAKIFLNAKIDLAFGFLLELENYTGNKLKSPRR